MAVAVLIEGLVIALLGLLVVGLLRSHAEIVRKLHELESGTTGAAGAEPGHASRRAAAGAVASGAGAAGTTAAKPAFDILGTSLADEVVKVGVAGARTDTLLAFLSSGCLTCIGFWDQFRTSRRLPVPGDARLVIVTKDPAEESLSRLTELAPRNHTVVMSSAAWEQYGVPVAPYFAYVDASSGTVIAGGGASDWDQVVNLWSRAVERARRRQHEAAGAGSGGRVRHERADQALLKAGIRPGHRSLYPPEEES